MNARFLGLIALLFAGSSMLSGCFLDDFPCASPDNTVATETITNLAAFKGIKLAVAGDLNLTQDPNITSVMASGSQNLLDLLEYEVEDSILIIDSDHHCFLNSDLVFDISLPEITALTIAGTGNILTTTPLTVQTLELRIAGTGDLDLEVAADLIESKIAGAGDIKLEGTATELAVKIAGSGNVSAFDLITQNAYLAIAGSGDVETTVNDTLRVEINGSGNVAYKGSPTSVSSQINGSGSLIDAN